MKWEEAGKQKLQCLITAWAETWGLANHLISVSVSPFVYCLRRTPSSKRRKTDVLPTRQYSCMDRQVLRIGHIAVTKLRPKTQEWRQTLSTHTNGQAHRYSMPHGWHMWDTVRHNVLTSLVTAKETSWSLLRRTSEWQIARRLTLKSPLVFSSLKGNFTKNPDFSHHQRSKRHPL